MEEKGRRNLLIVVLVFFSLALPTLVYAQEKDVTLLLEDTSFLRNQENVSIIGEVSNLPNDINLDMTLTQASKGSLASYVRMLNSINRENYNLENTEGIGTHPQISLDRGLITAAEIRARELAEIYSHNRPNGKDFLSVLEETNTQYPGFIHENIGWGYTPEEAYRHFAEQPINNSIMFNQENQYCGIGSYTNTAGFTFWCQLYANQVINPNAVDISSTDDIVEEIPLEEILLNKETLDLTVGSSETLTLSNSPQNTTDDAPVYWYSEDTAVASVEDGSIQAHQSGSTTIVAMHSGIKASCTVTVSETKKTATYSESLSTEIRNTITYQTHVQYIGWQDAVKNGSSSGTTGQSLRLEGIRVNLDQTQYSGGIKYKTHIQDIGWQDWVSDGALSGTTGRSLRLEAVQIALTGEAAEHYDVYYRVHCQNFGWMGWAKNGDAAGSEGYAYRLEAIQIQLVEKNQSPPGSTDNAFARSCVAYQTHIQEISWQGSVRDGATSGTSGQALRLEGIRIRLPSQEYSGGIQYRTHIQNIGWQGWVNNGAMSGTTGRALRLEAIQISLTGQMASHYDVYYRVHCQNYGWLDWAKNGNSAGTSGGSLRLEAIQIQVIPKGNPAPGDTATPYVLCDSNIVMDTATVNVSGLQRDYHFLFISDTHIINITNNDPQPLRDIATPRAGLFTSETGVRSAALFPYYVDVANKNHVDALLMGGDIIDYPSDANINTLRSGLNRLESNYLYTVGNHDWYMWGTQNNPINRTYLSKLDEFTQNNSFYHTLEYDDLLVVALDNSTDQFTKEAADGLEEAVAKGKPIIVIMHIPLADSGLNAASTKVWGKPLTIGLGGITPNTDSKRVINLINQENNPIVAVLDGHLHLRYTNTTGNRTVQFVNDASYKGRGILLTLKKK